MNAKNAVAMWGPYEITKPGFDLGVKRRQTANLSVESPRGTTTEIDGSHIKRRVTYEDTDFTPNGLKQLAAPPESPQ